MSACGCYYLTVYNADKVSIDTKRSGVQHCPRHSERNVARLEQELAHATEPDHPEDDEHDHSGCSACIADGFGESMP